MNLILLIVLLLLLFGGLGLPNWGYHSYGYGPSGIVFTVLVIIVVLYLLRRL